MFCTPPHWVFSLIISYPDGLCQRPIPKRQLQRMNGLACPMCQKTDPYSGFSDAGGTSRAACRQNRACLMCRETDPYSGFSDAGGTKNVQILRHMPEDLQRQVKEG